MLPSLREKLNQRQVVMWLDWIVQIRGSHKPSSADANYLCSKALLCIMICQVLDYCIGIDHVKALVAKGQRTTIEDQCLHARKTTPVILHFGQRNAASVIWFGCSYRDSNCSANAKLGPEAPTLRMRIAGVGFNNLTKRRNFSSRDLVCR